MSAEVRRRPVATEEQQNTAPVTPNKVSKKQSNWRQAAARTIGALLVLGLFGGAIWLKFFTTPREYDNYRGAVIGRYNKVYYSLFPQNLTVAELARYNGSDPSLPLYIGMGGDIFDVSTAPQHYGINGGYKGFAGVDVAKPYFDLCFSEQCMKTAWDLSQFDEKQMKELYTWNKFYHSEPKYAFVGRVLRDPPQRTIKEIYEEMLAKHAAEASEQAKQ